VWKLNAFTLARPCVRNVHIVTLYHRKHAGVVINKLYVLSLKSIAMSFRCYLPLDMLVLRFTITLAWF
jgi:hypothetical protein